jgi:hypothetical protein
LNGISSKWLVVEGCFGPKDCSHDEVFRETCPVWDRELLASIFRRQGLDRFTDDNAVSQSQPSKLQKKESGRRMLRPQYVFLGNDRR